MSIITFEALQDNIESQKTVLVEMRVYMRVSTWTKTPGYTNIYQAAFTNKEFSDRKVSHVREDLNTWYTEKADIEDVDSNPESYYYDPHNEMLYAHSSGSDDPDNYIMTAYFWLYFANETKKPLTVNSSPVYFEPIIESAPGMKRSMGEAGKTGGDTWTVGNLVLMNNAGSDGTGAFDEVFYDYIWFSAVVRILTGGERLPYTEYQLAGTYIVKAPEKNFEVIKFSLSDTREYLKRKSPVNVYDTTTHPNLEKGKEGAVIPLMYGHVRDFRPTKIDTTTEELQCCSHNFIFLEARDDDVRVGFTTNNANGKSTLNASPVGTITADAVGLVGANLAGSAVMGADQNVVLEANKWYRMAYYGKSDGSAIILANLKEPGGKYLQNDRTWGAGVCNLKLMTIMFTVTSDFIGVSIPFKSGSAGTYVFLIHNILGTGTLYGDIVARTYELEGEIVKDICDNHIDLESDDYDGTSLTTLDTDRPYPLGIIIDKKMEADQIFTILDEATFSHHEIVRSGKLEFKAWAVPDDSDPDLKAYDRFTFIGMKEKIDVDSLRWKVSIGWGGWITNGKWNYESAEDTDTKYLYRITEEETIDTVLSYSQDASAVAALYLAMLKDVRLDVVLTSALRPLYSDLGNTISLIKSRSLKDSLAYLEIVGIGEDWNNKESTLHLFKMLS